MSKFSTKSIEVRRLERYTYDRGLIIDKSRSGTDRGSRSAGEVNMSYENMWRDENRCDFPGCNKEFDGRRGKRVARIRKNAQGKDEVIAFCEEHCVRLEAEGVVLRFLQEIHDEMTEAKEGPIRRRMEAERIAREKKFIEDLKK